MSRYKVSASCCKRRNTKIVSLLVVCVFSFPSWCIADLRNGNKLLADCGAALAIVDGGEQSLDTSRLIGAGLCLGFMQGIGLMNDFYQISALKGAALFCRPNGVNNGQTARIVVKYLRDHPEELHKDELSLTLTALRAAFPCANRK
jgi:hypothetical protein